ncbi:C-CAP/cofactor C-like domain-containing protein [Psidium guajava]|nr:C-CAP/cofactor C-like domain-containing protein [Psidium guajava]
MASFSHFWVLALFLAAVLLASQLASSRSCDGGRVAHDLPSFSLADRKRLDRPALIGKNAEFDIGTWCVPENGTPDPKLQADLDFACGNGANCDPIKPGGPCFEPNTVKSHATYAMNDYFQSHGKNLQACNFSGTGIMTNQDPSYDGCKYPGGPKDRSTTVSDRC